jgi:hypothetical protein
MRIDGKGKFGGGLPTRRYGKDYKYLRLARVKLILRYGPVF